MLGYFAGGAGDEVDPARQRRRLGALAAAAADARRQPRAGARAASCSAASSRCRSWWPRSPSSAWSIPRARWRWRAPRPPPGPRCASRPWPRRCPPRSPRPRPAGRHLFQLYCFSDEGVTRALMDQAVASGFEAILVTVDAPRAGNRERDLRTGFVLPEGLGIPSVAAALGAERAVTVPEAFELIDPCLGWPDLEALASDCGLPILVKGIHTAEDAALAIEHGAAGDRRLQPRRPPARPRRRHRRRPRGGGRGRRRPRDGPRRRRHPSRRRRRDRAGARRRRGPRRPARPLGPRGRRRARARGACSRSSAPSSSWPCCSAAAPRRRS